MTLSTGFLRRAVMLVVTASSLAACCTPTTTPGSFQEGSGSCGAYFTVVDTPAGGGRR